MSGFDARKPWSSHLWLTVVHEACPRPLGPDCYGANRSTRHASASSSGAVSPDRAVNRSLSCNLDG
jgi:hypothetical protein